MKNLIINVLEKIINYLEPLIPTANCHMVDFFTKNIYEKYIPSEIRSELYNLNSGEALDAFWHPNNKYKYFNEFIENSKKNTLPNFTEICLDLKNLEHILIKDGCLDLTGFRLDSFMSSKKSHEVEILSKIATAVNEIKNINYIIDIGDGKGYLSSALAMHKNLRVLGIDSSVVNTEGAAKRVAKINKILGRKEKKCDNDLYKRTTEYITENTDLNGLVTKNFNENVKNIGLVGLHTCGDLATSCLKIFNSNKNIQTICNVGCCYHLLTEDLSFPMSNYLKNKNFKLQRNARMIAAQSLDRMINEKEKPSDILFFRSVLQVLLEKYLPNLNNLQAGRFKKPVTFHEYVVKNLTKSGCLNIPSDDVINNLYNEYLPKIKELQIFYLLRAHLAPVVEAVILLDRLLFLHELGYKKSYLVKLFDPVISPRCYGIISIK